jgi:hypothetical protein
VTSEQYVAEYQYIERLQNIHGSNCVCSRNVELIAISDVYKMNIVISQIKALYSVEHLTVFRSHISSPF